MSALPTFAELARNQLAAAGPRDKTINVKVAINTARMMVEHESYMHESKAILLAALRGLLYDFTASAPIYEGGYATATIGADKMKAAQEAIARVERAS